MREEEKRVGEEVGRTRTERRRISERERTAERPSESVDRIKRAFREKPEELFKGRT